MFQPLNAKVEAPNYDFSLEALADFFPGKPVAPLETKNGKPEVVSSEGGLRVLKYFVAHVRYKFPVIVQEKEGTINDFFARLPSYFLHDIFLQSLVKKHGKQNSYKKVGEEAFYVWEVNGEKHIYSAACTITCFPIFYAVQKSGARDSVLEKMKKANMP
jgi:hypothetical protein